MVAQGPKGDKGDNLAPTIRVSTYSVLKDRVRVDGVYGPGGESPGDWGDNTDELHKYRYYIPTVSDIAICTEEDPNYSEFKANDYFFFSASIEWEHMGALGGAEGPKGEPGQDGNDGRDGKEGPRGPQGWNGANGGAYAHAVEAVPSSGPPGKIFLYVDDMTMYVTVR